MYILLTAATPFEIGPVSAYLEANQFRAGAHEISIAITGIGAMMTTYALTTALRQRRPDFMIQAGIAGSFTPNLLPPGVVIIGDEATGDLGAAEGHLFNDLFDLGLMESNAFPFSSRKLVNPIAADKSTCYGLPVAHGITVNEISTGKGRIGLLRSKYQADVESMEGCSFHYIGLMEKLPFLQVRSISNMVGERNKQNWKMKEAIGSLNETLINLLPQL